MLWKIQVSLFVMILLTTSASLSDAYPDRDEQIRMTPFWQNYVENWSYRTFGCNEDDVACERQRLLDGKCHSIGCVGCTLTSMAMLYLFYGFDMLPNLNHEPMGCYGNICPWRLNPRTFNNYLSGKDPLGGLLGFDLPSYDLNWYKTTTNFYYYLPGSYILHYDYVVPNYDCAPFEKELKTKNGKSASCWRVRWSDPKAMTWLNHDISWTQQRPAIMEIDWTDYVDPRYPDGRSHKGHFVVIAGYEKKEGRSDEDGWYRAHNPMFHDNAFDNEPKPLKGETQYGKKDLFGKNEFRFDRMTTLLRFKNEYSEDIINTIPEIYLAAHSPVEMQVIDPDGNLIGHDPETGKKFLENPMSLYYRESPVTSLYGTDKDTEPADPAKILSIAEAQKGNYIFKIFGTGDGPYTIDMELRKSDGTPSLITTLTGTATPTLTETYRIKYSPTGEASISQTNQAPIANAGADQTGEQSYEITLDGSASSDPDGDPMKYTWSFAARPPNSAATLSDKNAVKPAFTPDLPGTYTLQLVVNDHFTDSEPSTVTITATPVRSRLSVTPNFSSPLNEGPGFISFDVNNIGRIGVTSGNIDLSLTDPDGQIVSTGSQAFSIAVGENRTVSVPVAIPPLKFGNYILTYSQSDETRTGIPTTSTVPNSVLASFSFDKITYRVRETANVTLNITNNGKFNLRNLTVNVSVPDAGFSNNRTASRVSGTLAENFEFTLPSSMTAGQHTVNASFGLPSGSTNIQSAKFTVPASALTIGYSGEPRVTVGETIRLTLENTGGVDTAYTAEKLVLKDARGMEIDLGPVSGTISAGESKAIDLEIPSQAAAGYVMFSAVLNDAGAGRRLSFDKTLSIAGLEAALSVRTDKDVYLSTAPVTALESVTTADFDIADGLLDIKVTRQKEAVAEKFVHFLPKSGWAIFLYPLGVAVAPDGAFYVADTSYDRIQKFSEDGRFLTKWGSYGTGGGQFNTPIGIATGPDGSVYVADSWNNRIQKFDSNGNFISTWGSFGSEDGQFHHPKGIAVGSDETVYVADSENSRIQKFDSNGNCIGKWVTRDGERGITFSPSWLTVFEGYVYVTDPWNRRILKFDGNGNFILKWGRYGSGSGQFLFPTGISVSSDGYVFVADDTARRIQKFDSNGNFVSKWGSPGSNDSQFEAPNGIAVSTNGHVYVADTRNSRIQKFDTDGNFIEKWARYGRGPGQFYYPYGIASGLDGSVYVADTSNYRIQKFDGAGNLTVLWGGNGAGAGKFHSPVDVAAGTNGAVYVVDSMNHSIQQFDADGNFIAQWGNYGSGNGQFDKPSGIAVALDGSVFVADTNNNRIQKFDQNGIFLLQWGGFCNTDSNWDMIPDKPCDGGFSAPQGVAIGNDGSIYVADTKNHRVQKFDGNGNYIAQWGRKGSGGGQFSQPQQISTGPGGSVYVADTWNSRIQKFDSNGTFLASWGYYGKDDGQFSNPSGIAVDQEGTVYIADTRNHRIQKMTVPGEEVLFKETYPVDQASNVIKDHVTSIGALNTSGKLYLRAILKNALGQTLAQDDYPFYMVTGDTALLFDTDKKFYRTGETISITGEVRNLAAAGADDLTVGVKWKAGAAEAIIYTEMFSLPAGGSHPFTAILTADSEGTVLLTGTVSQSDLILAEVIDQYEVAGPKVIATVAAPEAAGNDPFTMNVELRNEGKVEATTRVQITDDRGQTLVDQEIIIPAGETRLVQTTAQEIATTIYTFTFTGDLNQTITKTVAYGLSAGIQSSGLGFYPEGNVAIPVTITNTGLLDETLSVSYNLTGGLTSEESRSYFIPRGGSVTDILNYDLVAGSYQLMAHSSLPAADANANFSVLRENRIAMTSTAGPQGANGLIPVTVNLTNSGYNDISGTLALAVMNNDGKAVWRGEAGVSNLKSRSSGDYTINVDSAGIISGAYATNIMLYSSSGIQLASNQTQVRVPGPIFEITSVPANPAFTAGKEAVLNFTVRNTGTAQGATNFSVRAMDVLNRTVRDSFEAGEGKSYSFSFAVPEDAEEKDYPADYILTPAMSQATKGQAGFRVNEVKVDVAASLDKEAYRNGQTAVLTLNVSKLSQTEDGTYVAIVRYGSHHDMQPFTLSSQPVTLTFSVPLPSITGERLFYGIHFESGKDIHRNSVAINEALPDLAANFTGQMTEEGVLIPEVGRSNTMEIAAKVTNYGNTSSTATTLSLYDGDALIDTRQVRALNPGESAEVFTSWNVLGKAGDRDLRAMVDPDDAVAEFSEANNTGTITVRVPGMTIFTDTDRDTYKIRQKAYITSTLTNLTSETTYSNLLLLTSAEDHSGQEVYNKSTSLGSLAALSSTTSNEVWSTSGLAADGIYTITQRVFAGSEIMAQSSKDVTLEKAPDFTLNAEVTSNRVKQGETATYTVTLAPINGWTHETSLSLEGLPTGASASFDPDKLLLPGQAQTLVVTMDTTPAGTHTLYLTAQGTDEGEIVSHTLQLTLDVAGYGLETGTETRTLKQLETATYPVNLTSLNGYEGSVSLSVSGLPNGTKATLDNAQLEAPGAATLTVRTSKYAKPGTYAVTITGNDGLASHSLNLSLVLQQNPDIAAGIIAAPGPGPRNPAMVRLYSADKQLINEFTGFRSGYGANAVSADIDGDGYDEIIIAQGPGPENKARLRAFKRDGTLLGEYTAFKGRYGLALAAGDFDGDWKDEIVIGAGAGPGSPSRVMIAKYDGARFVQTGVDFHAFAGTGHHDDEENEHGYGVNIATGDLDGDHAPELIVAPGPGPKSPAVVRTYRVDVSQGTGQWTIAATHSEFTAFTRREAEGRHDKDDDKERKPAHYGVHVAAGDTDGDGIDEIIAGAGPGPDNISLVKVFRGDGTYAGLAFIAYPEKREHKHGDANDDNDDRRDKRSSGHREKASSDDDDNGNNQTYRYGVYATSADLDADGIDEIITGPGPGPHNKPLIKVFKADGTEVGNFPAYPAEYEYGVQVSGGSVGNQQNY